MPIASLIPAALAKKPMAGTLSLVFGGLAVLVVWMPLVSLLSWIFAPLGLLFGLFALRNDVRSRTATAGVGLSLLGIVGCLAWIFIFYSSFTVRPSRPGESRITYSEHEERPSRLL